MKRSILIISIVLLAFIAHAQDTNSDSLYIVTYTTGTAWDFSKSAAEQPHFKAHSNNLAAWRKAGTIKFGARAGEKGIIIIAARSLHSAKKLILEDVAVVNGLFTVDVQKLKPFYYGCVEE